MEMGAGDHLGSAVKVSLDFVVIEPLYPQLLVQDVVKATLRAQKRCAGPSPAL